jgi:cellulose synthase/poly-beta-1,6-N-acetylglucosamine synthase-like glycosyltransferase
MPTAVVGTCVGAVLVAFTVRRLVLLAGALAPPRARASDAPPSVTLVVAARNETAGLAPTLDALAALAYPPGRLALVLVNDASDDGTGERLAAWAATRPAVRVLDLPERVGKPRAVAAGMAGAPRTDLVAVFDADVRPRRDYLLRVVETFGDPTVGGAVGFIAPANARASAIARYAALEAWVHQLVTSAGKDRLDLNPPTLGGAAVYRRAALDAIGGLGAGPSGDDVLATVALTRAGWRTRFVRDAVADVDVVSRWPHYRRQHVRWTRDLFATAAPRARADAVVPLARRAERWMLSAGYLDRLAFVAAVALVASGRLSPALPLAYLAAAAAGVAVALGKAGAARETPLFVLAAVAGFALDAATTIVATALLLAGRPRVAANPDRVIALADPVLTPARETGHPRARGRPRP